MHNCNVKVSPPPPPPTMSFLICLCVFHLKFQERVSSLENCPWCSSKGLAYALRSYRINFQESITLCTNSQCLFPLVSRPLEEVLAELAPVEEHIGGKRKVLQNDDAAVLPSKRLRSNGDEQVLDVADLLVTDEEPPAIEADGTEFKVLHNTCAKALRSTLPSEGLTPSEAACQGESAKDKSDYVLVPTCSPPAGETALASASPLSSEGVLGATSAEFASHHASELKDEAPSDVLFRQANGPLHGGLRPGNLDSNQCRVPVEDSVDNNFALPPADELIAQKPCSLDSDGTSMLTEGTTNEVKPEALTPTSDQADQEKNMENVPPQMDTEGPEKLVSLPPRLFWKNSENLCWLDTLLVALVNCKSLRDHRPRNMPQKSPVWELIRKYDEICAAVQAHQHTGTDGVVRVPIRVLQNAYSDLQSIRMSVFKLLQPKLQCRLGQRETPVFALPVLMAADSWAESLFEQTFHWEFECSSCQSTSNIRVTKSLPTFTNLVQDWHPENAAHMAPCNVCHKKNQRRTMVLDSIPPVFALHFVDGLPDDDLQMFSFSFHGRRYSVSTVIQYSKTIKHFVAWIRTPNGLWQEFDDLKHPGCNSHAKLPVPAPEMHIVFWEMEEDPTRHTCSPTTTIVEAPPSHNIPLAKSPDKSLLPSYDDSDIVGALALSVEGSVTKGAMAAMDMDESIGSTTLLDTFEGLSHSDIVTLTLIEVRVPAPVVTTAAAEETPPDPTTQLAAATVSSSSASPPPCSQKSPELPPVPILQDRWTYLLSKRPQANGTPTQFSSPETPAASPAAAPEKSPVPIQCTPNPAKRPRPPLFKPQLMRETGELPLKHARMYDAFSASSKTTSTSSPHQTLPWQGTAPPAQCGAKSNTPLSTALPDDLGNTDTLRCKLLKKLKAKQKKLAKLNRLLGQKGEAAAEARPDSTERSSPQAVTSSTTGSTYDEFLSNLLSPASTASNLSPDSTGLLEMLANGKEVADQLDQGLNSTAVTSQVNYSPHCSLTSNNEDFLEEFLSGVAAQQQTETETQALHELDLFF
ncbi:unnamed protein product [Merluccius merluccius]